MALELVTLPCLEDNYAYLLHDDVHQATAVIDVPDAGPILDALAARGWQASEVWLTHHHWDHVDGAAALSSEFDAKIIGAAQDAHRLPPLAQEVSPGESFELFGREVQVIDVPGHTVGHVAFYMPSENALFSGDSLMALGCGRLFEGTPAQMYDTLTKLSGFPADTVIYSGHEYTADNADFAMTIEPGNEALQNRVAAVKQARAANNPTVPSLLSDELATNPFLRSTSPEVQATVGLTGADPVAVFTEVRKRKDNF